MSLDRDQDAARWGAELGLGNALFKDLAEGERFRFRTSTVVYVKKNRGYMAPDGRRYSTGARTAVWRVT